MIRPRTPEQNKKFWLHFGRLRLDAAARCQLALRFSGGRTGRTSELWYEEAQDLIRWLEAQLPDLKARGHRTADRQRKKILSIAHQLGWEVAGGRVDMQRLERWLVKYGCHHKGLNHLSNDELAGTITQMEQVLAKELDKADQDV